MTIAQHDVSLSTDIITIEAEFDFEITVDEDDHSHPDQGYARIVKSYSAEIQPLKAGDKSIDRDMLVALFGEHNVRDAEAAAAEEYKEGQE